MIKKSAFLLLVLIFLAFHLYPEVQEEKYTVKFSRLTTEDGLSIDSVNSITQDKRGFIWVGTIYGLNRYDGYNFKIYKHQATIENSLTHDWINTVFEDRYGFIWVGTKYGLNRLVPGQDSFKHYIYSPEDPFSLTGGHVTAIHEDSKGTLWIGTNSGLNKYDRKNDRFDFYRINTCRLIYEDGTGVLWIGTGADIYAFDEKKGSFASIRETHKSLQRFEKLRFTTILKDKGGNFWIGTFEDGLIKFNPVTKGMVLYKHDARDTGSIGDNEIRCSYETRSGELWFGTSTGGLNRRNDKNDRFTRYNFEANLERVTGNVMNAIFEDRYGMLWLGLYGKGITTMERTEKMFKSYSRVPNTPNTLSGGSVLAIYEDRDGLWWIGTDTGLNRYDPVTNRYTHYKHDPSNPGTICNDIIRAVAEDKFGRLWVGTHGGLDRLDEKRNTFIHYSFDWKDPTSLSHNMVKKIYKDRAGTLWIGTAKGLNRFDYDTNRFTRFTPVPGKPGSLSHEYVYTILEDRGGRLWIGTRGGGLNRFDRKRNRFIHFRSDPRDPGTLSNPFVFSLLEDQSGNLWVGTKDGLNRLNRKTGRFTHYDEKAGLPNNTIYGMQEEKKGDLWLSTNLGLCKFNPGQGVIKSYNSTYGLPDDEFNGDVSFKSKNGRFFFGGIRGFTAFYPGEIKVETVTPTTALLSLRLVGKREKTIYLSPDMNSITISHNERILAFEFAVFDFRAPKRNRYACKLEDFDSDWNYIGNRNFIIYTNPEPGKYVFNLKAADSENTWSKKVISLGIDIPPPFWKTLWFRMLMALFIVSSIFFFLRLKLNRVERQKKILEKLVAERTQDLEKERETAIAASHSKSEFLARMSHEIRTPLNSVIGFTEMLMDTGLNDQQTDFTRTINQSGEILLTLVNDILDFSKFEAGELSLEHIDFDPEDTAFTVCDLVRPRLENKPVEIFYNIHKNVPRYIKGDPGRFSQVLINIVGNATKFTEKGEIELSMEAERDGDRLILHTRVRDTGIGIAGDKLDSVFEVFQQADGSVTRKYGGSGLGLTISKQIAKRMGGDLTVESKQGEGSTFHFTARVGHSQQQPGEETPPGKIREKKVVPVQSTPVELQEGSLRILLVEDNPINRKLAGFMLAKAGYRLEYAANGREAVEKFTADPGAFDLILMDVQMPEMDGKEATRAIREMGFDGVPIIAMTAQTMKGDREACLAAGMNDYISKPIKSEVVFEMMEKWIIKNA